MIITLCMCIAAFVAGVLIGPAVTGDIARLEARINKLEKDAAAVKKDL